MLYQKDWLMRQIEAMIRIIAGIIFQREARSNAVLIPTEPASGLDPTLRRQIDAFLAQGQPCETEDWLFAQTDPGDIRVLRAALYFYALLNTWSDEELTMHNFPRDEIKSGLTEICRLYGLDAMLGS